MAKIIGIDVHSEPGWIIISRDSGAPVRYPIAALIRGEDIPEITSAQAATRILSIPVLANLIVILIRTLIGRGVLDESFGDNLGLDMDLDHLIFAVEQMGGEYHEPDLHTGE